MDTTLYSFNIIKLLVVAISIPVLLVKKQWVYYILAINIAVAAILACVRGFWINGLVGIGLTFFTLMYLSRRQYVTTTVLFMLAYLLWNVYFTEKVMNTNGNHYGMLTSVAMNIVPFIIFIILLLAHRDMYTCIWYFVLIRLIVILFCYIHLADQTSCHANNNKM